MATQVADLTFKMSMDMAQLTTDFQKIQNQFGALGSIAKKTLGLLGAGISVSWAKSLVNEAVAAGTALEKMSQKSGMSVESVSGLAHVLKMSGVEIESMNRTFKKLSNALVEAQQGTNASSVMFEKLGISTKGADGGVRDMGEIMEDVAGKFETLKGGAEKADLAVKLFGKSGLDMIPVMNKGRDGFRQLYQEAKTFGLVLDQEAAAKLKLYSQDVKRIGEMQEGMKRQLVVGLTPALHQLAEAYIKARKAGLDWKSVGEEIGTYLKAIAKLGITAAAGFHMSGTVISGFFKIIQSSIVEFANWVQGSEAAKAIWRYLTGEEMPKPPKFEAYGFEDLRDEIDLITDKYQGMIDALNAPVDVKVSKKGDGTITLPDAAKVKQAEDMIRKLSLEYGELGKHAHEVELLKNLESAGLTVYDKKTQSLKIINNEHTKEITALTEKIQKEKAYLEMQKALMDRVADAYAVFNDPVANLRDKQEDLTALAVSGKITWEAWAKGVQRTNEEIAKIEFGPKIAELETMKAALDMQAVSKEKGALTIARERMALIEKEIKLREDLLATMFHDDMTREELAAYQELLQALIKARTELVTQNQVVQDYTGTWDSLVRGVQTYADSVGQTGKQMEDLVVNSFKKMEDALVDFLDNGTFKWKEFGRAVLHELNAIIVKQMMSAALGKEGPSGGGGVLGGLWGLAKNALGFGGGMIPSMADTGGLQQFFSSDQMAKGGVFERGIRKYAQGGIFTSPKVFPMANGGVGLLGEAGPEAVMPLSRTADGKLGVKGGGEAGGVNITILAADSQSFSDMCRRNPNAIIGPISAALKGNGDLRYQIKQSMR